MIAHLISPYETPELYHHSLTTTCRNARNATDTMETTSSVYYVKPARFSEPDQCMNSDDRGIGCYYGYLFASSARCCRCPMRLV